MNKKISPMDRDLGKGVDAQKHTDKVSKSKFSDIQEVAIEVKKPASRKAKLKKLTAMIPCEDWEHLQRLAIQRTNERGKTVQVSEVLREILAQSRGE